MITLCKFVRNDREDSTNVLLTRTLGKLGVLHRESVASMEIRPRANEWWYCSVIKETGAGTNKGTWILGPIARVEMVERDGFRENDITYLYPGMFDDLLVDNTLLLYPRKKGLHWICPIFTRKHLMVQSKRKGSFTIHSIVVVFDGAQQWPRETVSGCVVAIDPGG